MSAMSACTMSSIDGSMNCPRGFALKLEAGCTNHAIKQLKLLLDLGLQTILHLKVARDL